MRVNFDATRAVLDTLRAVKPGIRVIYTSSQAVYGGIVPSPVTESVRPTPESAYGCEKMMCVPVGHDPRADARAALRAPA